MSVLFKILDRHLLVDALANSWNEFEDVEKFERIHGQNIRENIADFDKKKIKKLKNTHLASILDFCI